MEAVADSLPETAAQPWLTFSAPERIRLVVALYFVSVSSYMDRFVISILQEPIRHEFNLSDTQLGVLSGFAFAIFYAGLGLPIARWSDRGDRRLIIALSTFVWSLMTTLSGMVQNFAQLFVTRVGVGIGEAGTLPPSHSLVADYFPPQSRSFPLAMLTFGSSSGVALGVMGGGYIAQSYGWRTAYVALGVPGIVLAILVYIMVGEPRRRQVGRAAATAGEGFVTGLKTLLTRPAYVHLVSAMTVYFFIVGGAIGFMPSHLVRALHLTVGEVGVKYGLVTAIAAAIGAFAGGSLCDHMAKRDPRWIVRFPMIAMVVVLPLFYAFLLAESLNAALVCYFFAWCILTMGYPPIFAAVQAVAGAPRRATAVAFLFFMGALIGNGLGPVAAGALSDALKPRFGAESLRYSLMAVFLLLLWCAIHFWRAERTFKTDAEDRFS